MTSPLAGAVDLVPDPRDLALLHERAMPQKDQLCGPFWGALTLAAAGYADRAGSQAPARRKPTHSGVAGAAARDIVGGG